MDRRALLLVTCTAVWMGTAALGDSSPPASTPTPPAPSPRTAHDAAPTDHAAVSLERELEALRARLKSMSEALAPPQTSPVSHPESAAPAQAPTETPGTSPHEAVQSQLRQLREEMQSLREAMKAAPKPPPVQPAPPPPASAETAAAAPKESEVDQLRREVKALEELKAFRQELATLKQQIAATRDRIRQAQPASQAASTIQDYSRPALATADVKDEQGRVSVWINPAKWKLSTYRSNPEAELEFVNTSGDAYAFVIAEKLVIPPDTIPSVALSNAQAAAPDARLVFQDRRRVNGREVVCLQIEGTVQQAVPFTYLGYYYSDPSGTVQVVTSTTQQAFAANQGELTDFLNGVEIASR
jgi:chemotaxis protein histidine kinase CheA